MNDWDVARCTDVSWRDDYGTYWLMLTFQIHGGGGVAAMFDCAALSLLMPHVAPAQASKPENLKGKLFQLRWSGGKKEGHCGNVLEAIRIHPAYADCPQPWLKSQILLFEKDERAKMRTLLEIANDD